MLRRQDVLVGKWYVNNKRNVARAVVRVDEKTIQFNTHHLNNGNSCGSPSECTRLDFMRWADREASHTETLSRQRIVGAKTEDFTSRQAQVADAISSVPVDRGLILLVEDDPANVMMIGDYLEGKDFQVVVAHNGLEALAQASEINPNIILMDIQMPVMDGFESIRLLRANPRFAATPIIALTALAMQDDQKLCLQAGASEYMSKPCSLKLLVEMIEQYTCWKKAGLVEQNRKIDNSQK
jgi:CheY-like chemotaxis protein